MRLRLLKIFAILAATGMTGGCSGGAGPGDPTIAGSGGGAAGTQAGYQLSAEEQALDCKKLNGRMQVRILQIRGFDASKAQGAGIGAMFGAKSPAERYAQEKAQLEAYNQLLASKKCPTFDLAKELQPQDNRHTPRTTPAASSATGAKNDDKSSN